MRKAVRSGASGALVVALGGLAATGRLPRNPLAGIRIPSTMRSDEAWRAGHHAAASALVVSGLGPIVATLIVTVKKPTPDAQAALLRVGTAWLLGWLGVATFQAHRAARATLV